MEETAIFVRRGREITRNQYICTYILKVRGDEKSEMKIIVWINGS